MKMKTMTIQLSRGVAVSLRCPRVVLPLEVCQNEITIMSLTFRLEKSQFSGLVGPLAMGSMLYLAPSLF